jgi:hypothetical protein
MAIKSRDGLKIWRAEEIRNTYKISVAWEHTISETQEYTTKIKT